MMQTLQQFLENNTSKLDCVMDLVKKMQEVFKDHSLITRKEAWKKLTSDKGDKMVKELIKTPGRSLSYFRELR